MQKQLCTQCSAHSSTSTNVGPLKAFCTVIDSACAWTAGWKVKDWLAIRSCCEGLVEATAEVQPWLLERLSFKINQSFSSNSSSGLIDFSLFSSVLIFLGLSSFHVSAIGGRKLGQCFVLFNLFPGNTQCHFCSLLSFSFCLFLSSPLTLSNVKVTVFSHLAEHQLTWLCLKIKISQTRQQNTAFNKWHPFPFASCVPFIWHVGNLYYREYICTYLQKMWERGCCFCFAQYCIYLMLIFWEIDARITIKKKIGNVFRSW